jgi:hypothetical protein
LAYDFIIKNPKKLTMKLILATTILFIALVITSNAQTQVVTLTVGNQIATASYNVATNQIVTFTAYDNYVTNLQGTVELFFANGTTFNFSSVAGIYPKIGSDYTGLTNIALLGRDNGNGSYGPSLLTLNISTPSVQSMIPANTVVIPTDANGSVQIVLESSSDLINWTSSLPGTYGNTYSNRFFRVRAIAQ